MPIYLTRSCLRDGEESRERSYYFLWHVYCVSHNSQLCGRVRWVQRDWETICERVLALVGSKLALVQVQTLQLLIQWKSLETMKFQPGLSITALSNNTWSDSLEKLFHSSSTNCPLRSHYPVIKIIRYEYQRNGIKKHILINLSMC